MSYNIREYSDEDLLRKLKTEAHSQHSRNMRGLADGRTYSIGHNYGSILNEIKRRLIENGAAQHPDLFPIAEIIAAQPAWRGLGYAADKILDHLDHGHTEWRAIAGQPKKMKLPSHRGRGLRSKK